MIIFLARLESYKGKRMMLISTVKLIKLRIWDFNQRSKYFVNPHRNNFIRKPSKQSNKR